MSVSPSVHPELSATLPANLLLAGEYAVTLEGGVGIGLAINTRASGSWSPGGPLRVQGFSGADLPSFSWPGDQGLLGACVEQLKSSCGDPGGEFSIDTSRFHRPDGSKRGYGSSAVMVGLLTALWYRAAGRGLEGLLQESIRVHRRAQGGRGSGYDVAASLCGEIIRFTGGRTPRAERVRLDWLPPMVLFTGAAPVATTGAVARFTSWMAASPGDAQEFLRSSNGHVAAILQSGSWEEGCVALSRYRKLAEELGTRIGVSAQITPPADLLPTLEWWKAVGAGNELGVGVLNGRSERIPTSPEAELLILSREGLVWQ